MNLDREQLFELLWSKPLPTVANHCQTSMPVLRQICLSHDIPMPWGNYKEVKNRPELPSGAHFQLKTAIAEAHRSLQFKGETDYLLPQKLFDSDPLIVSAQKTVMQDFALHGAPHMLRTTYGELAIRSSQMNLDRALRIMDTLIKAWKYRGYRIVNQEKETRVYLREVSMRVSIRETTTTEPSNDRFGSRKHISTGLLAFKVDGNLDREWKDGIQPLENHLKDILDHMEVAARTLEKFWEKRKAQELIDARDRQARAAAIKADPNENAAFEALVQEAQRWNELNILDKYLDALRDNGPRTPAFEQWLQWARSRRRLFDPVEKRKIDNGQ